MDNFTSKPNSQEVPQNEEKDIKSTTEANQSLQKQNEIPNQILPNAINSISQIRKNDIEKKVENIFKKDQNKAANNIFSKNTNSLNLFTISTVPQPQQPKANIFTSASKPMIKRDEEDDEFDKSVSNASSNNTKAQSEFKSRPDKLEMKFNYENPWNVLKTYNLRKFKSGFNASKEDIYMTLEKNKDFPDKIHIFVRANQTKVILFQSFGMKNLTDKISTFMNKEENLKFTVIKQQKVEDEEGGSKMKLVREDLKVQFQNEEDAKDFRENLVKELEERRESVEIQ